MNLVWLTRIAWIGVVFGIVLVISGIAAGAAANQGTAIPLYFTGGLAFLIGVIAFLGRLVVLAVLAGVADEEGDGEV